MVLRKALAGCGFLFASLFPAAVAQMSAPTLDFQDLQERGVQLRQSLEESRNLRFSSPAFSISNPTGYGASWGTAFFGVGGSFGTGGSTGLGVGIGLGDAANLVGAQVTLAALDTSSQTFSVSAKVHRVLTNTDALGWSVAVGWDDFAADSSSLDISSSLYGSTTVIFKLRPSVAESFSRLALTVGLGGGRYRRDSDILAGNDTVGVFASAALRIGPAWSAIAEWTGQDLALGVSVAPFPRFPLVITPAVRDITGSDRDPRLTLGAGVTFSF